MESPDISREYDQNSVFPRPSFAVVNIVTDIDIRDLDRYVAYVDLA